MSTPSSRPFPGARSVAIDLPPEGAKVPEIQVILAAVPEAPETCS